MTEIKISLKDLQAGFQESVADESLPMAERRFAARLCVLAAHVERVDNGLRSLASNAQGADKLLAGRINETRALVDKLAAPAAPASTVAIAPANGAATAEAKPAQAPAEAEVVDDEQAALDRFLAESAAEERAAKVAATRGKGSIVPIKAEPVAEPSAS